MTKIKFMYDTTISDRGERRMTVCDVVYGQSTLRGVTHCNPLDNFSRVKGRKIALTRAIKSLPKLERAMIWEDYFEKHRR